MALAQDFEGFEVLEAPEVLEALADLLHVFL